MPLSLVPLVSPSLPLFCSETLACSDTLVTCLDGGGAIIVPASAGTLTLAPVSAGAVTLVPVVPA